MIKLKDVSIFWNIDSNQKVSEIKICSHLSEESKLLKNLKNSSGAVFSSWPNGQGIENYYFLLGHLLSLGFSSKNIKDEFFLELKKIDEPNTKSLVEGYLET